MKVYLLYDTADTDARQCALRCRELIESEGFIACGTEREDGNAELDEARFLLFIAGTDGFNSPALSAKWRYFLNEIRWKRKKCGDVLLLTAPDTDLSRLPFALRDCPGLPYDKTDGLIPLIMSYAGGGVPVKPAAIPAAKPTETSVKTARADNGCKEDHVFERAARNEKPRKDVIPKERAHGEGTVRERTRAESTAKEKDSAPKEHAAQVPPPKPAQYTPPPKPPQNTPTQPFKPDSGSSQYEKPKTPWYQSDADGNEPFEPSNRKKDENTSENKKIGCVLVGLFAVFFIFFIFVLPNLV